MKSYSQISPIALTCLWLSACGGGSSEQAMKLTAPTDANPSVVAQPLLASAVPDSNIPTRPGSAQDQAPDVDTQTPSFEAQDFLSTSSLAAQQETASVFDHSTITPATSSNTDIATEGEDEGDQSSENLTTPALELAADLAPPSEADEAGRPIETGETSVPNESSAATNTPNSTTVQTPSEPVANPHEITQTTMALLDDAIRDGNSERVSLDALITDATASAGADIERCIAALGSIYASGISDASMPYLSNTVFSNTRNNYPLHVNHETGDVYSWIGEQGVSRYAYVGASIFQLTESSYWGNLGNTLVDNTLEVFKWIFSSDSTTAALQSPKIILALDSRSKYQIEAWLQFHDLQHRWTITDDQSRLITGEFDLLAGLNNIDTATSAISKALEHDKHIYLWSENFDPGSSIHALGLSWNWWGSNTIGAFDSITEQCEIAHPSHEILLSFEMLGNAAFDFTYDDDNCPTHIYTTQCQANSLINSEGQTLQEHYLSGLESIRTSLQNIDYEATSVFDLDDSYRLLKLAVLSGDKLRTEVSYPLDKQSTNAELFYQALFADYSNHYAREQNIAQLDSGDFSKSAVKIYQMPAEFTSLELNTTPQAGWTSTGITAKPGTKLTLTRTDGNPSTVSVRFNMQRSQSTWIWNTFGYSRPKFIASNPVSLATGSSISISSPIGGPVYIYLPAQSSDNSNFKVEVSGGAKHPWLDMQNNSNIHEFTDQILQQDFDWVDVKTPYVEVHSLIEHMQSIITEGLASAPEDTAQEIIQLWTDQLDQYLIQTNLSLAGFSGNALPSINNNVSEFCVERNLNCEDQTIHKQPPKQHIVADYNASCGDFCSGNPFDLNQPVNPLGFGESHEMGHNLQRHRLNFYATRSLETSNNVFPYFVAFSWLLQEGATVHPTQLLPSGQKIYQALQENIANKAIASIGHPIWHDAGTYDNWDVRLGLYLQLVFIHDQWERNTLDSTASGWDMLTKLYLLERHVTANLLLEKDWLDNNATLGFSQFTYEEAKSMSGNDFMAIALTSISSKDHRAYLNLWGIELSEKAYSQIESNGFSGVVAAEFWKYDNQHLPALLPSREASNLRSLDGFTDY